MRHHDREHGQGHDHGGAPSAELAAPGKHTLTGALADGAGGPIQRKAGEGGDAGAGSAAPATSGEGRPLPDGVRGRMESLFGAGFGDVRVHEGPKAAAVGALAFTQGTDLHFQPGQYDPESAHGQALIGHELTHVVQQARGEVRPTGHAHGVALNDAAALEGEADAMGARAASAPAVDPAAAPRASASTGGVHAAAPIQAARGQVIQRQGPTPAEKQQGADLVKELQALVAGATWKEIRKTAYPRESAAGITRAKERKQGARPDLTGLGQIKTLEHFAAAIKALQAAWGAKSPDERVKAVGAAIDDELATAKIPKLLGVRKIVTEFKGSFSPGAWQFNLSEALVTAAALSTADAAELCNTGLHEARHAEQNFLSARFAAGPPGNKDAATIAGEQGIPVAIATVAVAQKFDAKTDPAVAALGKQMYQANVTDGAKNQRISDDDYLPEMAVARAEADTALKALQASIDKKTLADAVTKRDKLKAAIAEVEKRYTAYRSIPYEADAHEVGDAAEQAFKGWP